MTRLRCPTRIAVRTPPSSSASRRLLSGALRPTGRRGRLREPCAERVIPGIGNVFPFNNVVGPMTVRPGRVDDGRPPGLRDRGGRVGPKEKKKQETTIRYRRVSRRPDVRRPGNATRARSERNTVTDAAGSLCDERVDGGPPMR